MNSENKSLIFETYDFQPKGDEAVCISVPIPDNGNGEGWLSIILREDSIEFSVGESEEAEEMYACTDTYEDFCDFIEERDLYLDAMREQSKLNHPTSVARLQVIDGGEKS